MNPLISVDIGLYFEVSNSDMFGGEGTVGYSATKFEGVGNLDAIDDSFVQKQIESVAQMIICCYLKMSEETLKKLKRKWCGCTAHRSAARPHLQTNSLTP